MRARRRVLLLILDGFGIGEMADVPEVRPQDRGSNTLLHLAEALGEIRLPTMQALGLGNILSVPGLPPAGGAALASWGRSALKHAGADTYAGHQEIAGSRPGIPAAQRMAELAAPLASLLEQAGHRVRRFGPGGIALLVDDEMVVADNLEGEAAQNINVTAGLERVTFQQVCRVAERVREAVSVGRVIAVTGLGFGGLSAILANLEERDGLYGVNTPAVRIYNDLYQVRHLVLGADRRGQCPTIVHEAGMPVTLIGKAADVIVCDGAALQPSVETGQVLDDIQAALSSQSSGLIFANVQETDLAGHEQDARRYAAVLSMVDRRLPAIMDQLGPDDLLIIAADHGNDPLVGTKHTREYTPVLAWFPGIRPASLGLRESLADLGATVADALGLRPTQAGTSFYDQLTGVSGR